MDSAGKLELSMTKSQSDIWNEKNAKHIIMDLFIYS
jgi:hypothetical protein